MLGSRQSQHDFAKVPAVRMARSQFDRSFAIKDTFDFDYLIPIFVDEMLPGDTANVTLNTFARLATQKVPIMDNLFIDFFFFFVPNRLVWDNWERFNGAQDDPDDTTDYILPQMTFPVNTPDVGTLYDKFGLPTDVPAGYLLKNTLPIRCYNLIWNQWFRDQNMQNSVVVDKDNGPDAPGDYVLLKRGKRHDYFTSCLPTPQKGPEVLLPLNGSAPINAKAAATGFVSVYSDGSAAQKKLFSPANSDTIIGNNAGTFATDGLYADLTDATASSINQFREAIQLQGFYELDMRGGTRYVEILQAHFNVTSPDFRLQRPEYLGGGSTRINSHPVAQTAPTSGSNPQGQLAAFATSSTQGTHVGFTKSFVEHGYVVGLACARADLTYQQGINRMWDRSTRLDFYWPKFAELGEQAVLTKEIYLQGTSADDVVFGYQERYAEYRFKPSEIHGQFRSTYTTPLDQWHMAEEFGSAPELNESFIVQNTPIDRAIAVTSTGATILFDAYFQYKHARPMPVYSVPATLGRF